MAQLRPGYFRLPPAEIGATLIFLPKYTPRVAVVDLARWAKPYGFNHVAYVPARSMADTGAEA